MDMCPDGRVRTFVVKNHMFVAGVVILPQKMYATTAGQLHQDGGFPATCLTADPVPHLP